MLRAYLTEEKRCYGHPHRVVRTSCARCKTPFCDECLTTHTEGIFERVVAKDEKHPPPLFCERCVHELEALEAAEAERRRPWWQRLRPTRAGLQRAAIYLAVVAVIMVPMAFAVRNIASTTLTPEEIARFVVGMRGTFQTEEGTDFLQEPFGGRFISASHPARPNHGHERLIDTFFSVPVPGWRSADATLPQEIVFALPQPMPVNKVILRPQPNEPEDTWIKEFEVLVSTEGPNGHFTSLGRWTLDIPAARAGVEAPEGQRLQPPRFEFEDAPARYVMLRVYSNHGSQEYTSLGEFEVYWVKR
ncbi:MAG TPA: discoidin domain-containing protein [Chloroflexota bacterium]|nr:discoidin domain-containing protein [Chloroflexota bacterium]